MPNFDAIIIGTGQSGPALARRLVAAGRKVAIIERKLFGGTCVNTGCTPTKTLIASAYAAHVSRRAADYGIRIEGPVNVDMKAMAEVRSRTRRGMISRSWRRIYSTTIRDE
jgi:pyruvate/2-oxoglutarate dehydrogenase complex dihydrolipoamide dehydrogenase (E3) component